MNYIVFDLEWNQCPSGKENEVEGLPFEIFEIGAVKLDDNREETDRFSCYIKPAVYKELHYIAKGLTHASMEVLNEGAGFSDAVRSFFDWCGEKGSYRMCTWGSMDLTELQRNMRYFGVESPLGFPLFYYDVQKLFSIAKEDGKLRRSLETAVDMLGLDKGIEFHNAISDALYTAKVLQSIDFGQVSRFFSIDTYYIPKSQREEICVNYGSYVKFVSMGYNTREELLDSPGLRSTKCYICGRNARKKIRWFTVNTKMHYCLAECKEHGYIKGRFKIREDEFGKFYATKIMKQTDEEGAEKIRQRQQEGRRRRHDRRQKKKRDKSNKSN